MQEAEKANVAQIIIDTFNAFPYFIVEKYYPSQQYQMIKCKIKPTAPFRALTLREYLKENGILAEKPLSIPCDLFLEDALRLYKLLEKFIYFTTSPVQIHITLSGMEDLEWLKPYIFCGECDKFNSDCLLFHKQYSSISILNLQQAFRNKLHKLFSKKF